ncbi:MAG: hypothetical protein FJ109_02890 [Deltaproteobacteria bacterium]|nr:hypothetical protein [Deltaproteobacteria bacterium]
MRFFLNSARSGDIRAAALLPYVGGVTVQQGALADRGATPAAVIEAVVASGRRDWKLFFQMSEGTAHEVVDQAVGLDARMAERTGGPLSGPTLVCMLKPLPESLFAASVLVARGIEVCISSVSDPVQALAVSTFPHVQEWRDGIPCTEGPPASRNPGFPHSIACMVGRLDDAGGDGVAVVARIAALYAAYGIRPRVLAADVRSLDVLQRLTNAVGTGGGLVDVTLPFEVLSHLLDALAPPAIQVTPEARRDEP